ncbi:bifunctional phosphatase PAP2/diacylglycerol kinase family protein [Rhodococcus aerolatus]
MGRSLRRVGRGDRWLVRRTAHLPAGRVDGALRLLTLSADHSKVWTGVAVLLASRSGPTRRGAVRGLAAVVVSSALANGVAKNLFPRRRPAAADVPARRLLSRPPTSSSFPSGHAASAAAFTTAVALESPAAAAAVAPLAVLVAYSRVHTGVHWPSDVAVGAALGTGVALATQRWWPARRGDTPSPGPAADAPALPDGEGLLVVVNPSSGDDDDTLGRVVRRDLPRARQLETRPDTDLGDDVRRALAEQPARALGVAGGDGTVQCVAELAAEHGLPLLVLPGGTLNHFARDLGAPAADDAVLARLVGAVDEGRAVAVDLADVRTDDGEVRSFVNTASIGGYPDAVRLRERWSDRWGKWPAAAAAMVRVLAAARPLRLEVDGEPVAVWVLFVGNGRYTPTDGPPLGRPDLASGLLDVRWLRADVPASRARLVVAALRGSLAASRTWTRHEVAELDVAVTGSPVSLALDGEVVGRAHRLTFRAHPAGLVVYR